MQPLSRHFYSKHLLPFSRDTPKRKPSVGAISTPRTNTWRRRAQGSCRPTLSSTVYIVGPVARGAVTAGTLVVDTGLRTSKSISLICSLMWCSECCVAPAPAQRLLIERAEGPVHLDRALLESCHLPGLLYPNGLRMS
jgi:hypothetical protein